MKLEGIHHITAITAEAQRNVDFYAGTLGLRLVKKTVNQDQPTVYHLFYADEQGTPGADLTFFEFPRRPPRPCRCRNGAPDRLAGRLGRGARLLGPAAERGGPRERARGRAVALRRSRGPRARAGRGDGAGRAADRRPPGGAGRARSCRASTSPVPTPPIPSRSASLLEALEFEPVDGGWEARGVRARRHLAATTSRRPSTGSQGAGTVHHIAWASTMDDHLRVAGAGDRSRRPSDARDRPVLVSLDLLPRAERGAVRDRDARARLRASTRTPSTWARS